MAPADSSQRAQAATEDQAARVAPEALDHMVQAVLAQEVPEDHTEQDQVVLVASDQPDPAARLSADPATHAVS